VYLVTPNAFVDTEDSSGNHKQCTYTSYDGLGYATSQNTSMVLGEPTTIDRYAGCNTSGAGSDSGTGQIRTTHTYDLKGNQLTTNDPDANALDASHLGCLIGATSYSLCNAFDGTFFILQLSQTNALNQSSSIGYQAPASGTAAGGFGLWPISSTDVNAKVTTFTYDPLGRSTATTLPAETTGLTTTTTSYTVWCSGSAAQTPCAEIDQSRRLNSSTTVTRRTFYDGEGHLVETRSAAPNSQDVVTYSYYDASERLAASSVPYFVTAYTGAPGSAAFSIPDSTQATTVYNYDGLGRQTSITDALQHPFLTSYTVVCGPGSPDSLCYSQTTSTDPLGHQTASLADAWGRTQYVQTFTGSNPYALYGRTKYGYDVVGNLTQIHPNGTTTTTFQFDMAGRQTGIVDPDLGTESYQYDADGNLTQSIDARGASAFAAYDPIDRPKWRNTTNSPPGAYVTYAYDSTANGNAGVGRLTSETFSGAPNNTLSGSETFVYDARGQLTSSTLVVGSTSYPLSNITYNDAGEQLTATYPDGDIVTNAYGAQGWLASVGTQAGTLMSGVGFTGIGGAAGFITGATLAPGSPSAYQYSATYDLLDRPTDLKVSLLQSVLFEQARTFDAAGNVSTANTTLSTGTDHQAFCYDEQNRLTAAASSGTVPCQTFSPGTLTAANYNQSFSYDNMGRLASGPAGAYTYGDPAHVHAATAIGSSYTAAYDLGGNMSCRAPTSSSTCTGTQTGAQLTYNNEGQLSYWKNQPSNPTSSASFLYDGQGKRVAQQTTVGGSTTTTAYIGDFEEDATIGGTTTKTSYYYAGGWRFSLAVNGAVSYLASDGLGSANVTLAANGNVTAAMLYAPYGSVRYVSGTMPTDRGFTGQIADATSGLDYYGARYYDPTAGQFSSADLILPGWGFDPFGLSRYAYVEGNPVAWTDPTGASCVPACHPGGSDAMHFYPAPTGESPLGKCVKDPGCLATAVVSTGVGLAVTGACEAVTGGVATPVCVVAGGEASGLVAGAADCGGDSSYGSCVAVSMVVGGVTAGVTYGALRGFSRWNTSDDMAAPVSSDTEAPPAPSGASEPSIPSSPSIRAPEATNTQPSLPFRDPALRDQVQKVVTHVDEHGAPPPNVYRGGAPGYPVGTYLNKNGRLPSQIVGYYAESDVWPGALGNRGPARLVLGDDGDVYYSPNHYEDFIRIR